MMVSKKFVRLLSLMSSGTGLSLGSGSSLVGSTHSHHAVVDKKHVKYLLELELSILNLQLQVSLLCVQCKTEKR